MLGSCTMFCRSLTNLYDPKLILASVVPNITVLPKWPLIYTAQAISPIRYIFLLHKLFFTAKSQRFLNCHSFYMHNVIIPLYAAHINYTTVNVVSHVTTLNVPLIFLKKPHALPAFKYSDIWNLTILRMTKTNYQMCNDLDLLWL